MAALLRYLRDPLGAHIVGVFADYSCVHQLPRDRDEETIFSKALAVMASGYASLVGTTVARFTEIPRCPHELESVVGIKGPGRAGRIVVRRALAAPGDVPEDDSSLDGRSRT